MNWNTIKTFGQSIGEATSKNSPTILTALGVTGLVGTVILAVRATTKADSLIADELARKQVEAATDEVPYPEVSLKKMEVVKLVWPCYIPTLAMGGVTIACIVGANSINLRRNAILASAYALADKTLKNYQEAVVEQIGKGKEEKVRGAVAQNLLDKNPVEDAQVIIAGPGETLFYESLTGRYFKSDVEMVRRSINDFNKDLIVEMNKPFNDFLLMMGLEDTDLGEALGWSIDDGMLEVDFSAKIASNNTPCIVLGYKRLPKKL